MNTMIFALASDASFSDRVSEALIVSLQGMMTIFVILALLWVAVEIMHFILHRGDKKEKAPKEQAPKAEQSAPAPTGDAAIAAAIAAAMAASEDDGATVAAITAAISAMRAEEGTTGNFRVVSFTRVGRANGRRR